MNVNEVSYKFEKANKISTGILEFDIMSTFNGDSNYSFLIKISNTNTIISFEGICDLPVKAYVMICEGLDTLRSFEAGSGKSKVTFKHKDLLLIIDGNEFKFSEEALIQFSEMLKCMIQFSIMVMRDIDVITKETLPQYSDYLNAYTDILYLGLRKQLMSNIERNNRIK